MSYVEIGNLPLPLSSKVTPTMSKNLPFASKQTQTVAIQKAKQEQALAAHKANQARMQEQMRKISQKVLDRAKEQQAKQKAWDAARSLADQSVKLIQQKTGLKVSPINVTPASIPSMVAKALPGISKEEYQKALQSITSANALAAAAQKELAQQQQLSSQLLRELEALKKKMAEPPMVAASDKVQVLSLPSPGKPPVEVDTGDLVVPTAKTELDVQAASSTSNTKIYALGAAALAGLLWYRGRK